MDKKLELYKKLYLDDEATFTMGEKDFFNAIKSSNMYLNSIERYTIFKEIIVYLNNKKGL